MPCAGNLSDDKSVSRFLYFQPSEQTTSLTDAISVVYGIENHIVVISVDAINVIEYFPLSVIVSVFARYLVEEKVAFFTA